MEKNMDNKSRISKSRRSGMTGTTLKKLMYKYGDQLKKEDFDFLQEELNILNLCDVSISEAEVCRHCGSKAIIDFGIAKKCSDCRKML